MTPPPKDGAGTPGRQPNGGPPAGADTPRRVRIAIVGSGFSGIGMGVRLLEAGIDDFVLLERAGDLGGTWRDNTYPGCVCDVPSHLYSYSFAPNPGWSRSFSPQEEIWDYLRRCSDDRGVTPRIRFRHEVTGASWGEAEQRWLIETTGGQFSAEVLIVGQGPLSDPHVPDIPGLDSFEGEVFHSAAWNHDHDLRGERVAVIGTGASAIQFVPEIQPLAGRLHVFQRTPPWIVPRRERRYSSAEHRLFRALPPLQYAVRGGIYAGRELLLVPFLHPRLARLGERRALHHLESQVADPALRARLTPGYRFGCKRILLSNDYYPALTQPNVELVTDAIKEVRPRSIVTADGAGRAADAIIFGTGFRVTDFPIAEGLRGRGSAVLADVWDGSPRAHLGSTVPGFPNMFFLIGPNTGLAHNSIVYMIESQIAYVMDCLRVMAERGAATVEVLPHAEAAFNADVQGRMRGTVWTSEGCRSWYLDRNGRSPVLWPRHTFVFRRRTRRFDPGSYRLEVPAPRAPVRSAVAADA